MAGDHAAERLTVVLRPLMQDELSQLEQHVAQDYGNRGKHRRRLALQEEGRGVYVVAWLGELPVGHALVTWPGESSGAPTPRPDDCPDVEDLFVVPHLRSRGIGSQLLDGAELLAKNSGYGMIGLGVDVTNSRARALYERRGYADAGLAPYRAEGTWVDHDGQVRTWEETCLYLVKILPS